MGSPLTKSALRTSNIGGSGLRYSTSSLCILMYSVCSVVQFLLPVEGVEAATGGRNRISTDDFTHTLESVLDPHLE